MKMKKFLLSAACALGVMFSSSASAGIYKLDFTASGFATNAFNNPSVVDAVTGSFTYSTFSNSTDLQELLGVSLMINGHAYDVAGVLHKNVIPGLLELGGALQGPNSMMYGTHDFYLSFYAPQNNGYFSYATTTANGSWDASNVAFAITEVPEPAPAFLFFAAMGGLILVRRKFSQK